MIENQVLSHLFRRAQWLCLCKGRLVFDQFVLKGILFIGPGSEITMPP